MENPEQIKPPLKYQPARRSRGEQKYLNADHKAVILTIDLLKSLDVGSLCAKLEQIENGPPYSPECIPNALSLAKRDLWAKNRLWKRYEAALLSFGFIIDVDNRNDFEDLLLKNLKPTGAKVSYDYFPLFRAFQERDKLLTNSNLFADNYEFQPQQKAPAISIIGWFEKMEINLPNGLADRVKYFQSQPSVAENETPETLSKKERTSLLTLIYAMGKKPPFSYDPDDSRNGAISRIQSAITEAGLRMSDKTIRKYLREANSEAENIHDKSQ